MTQEKSPLQAHEELCEYRYSNIQSRLERLEKYAVKAVVGLLTLLFSIIAMLINIVFKLQ